MDVQLLRTEGSQMMILSVRPMLTSEKCFQHNPNEVGFIAPVADLKYLGYRWLRDRDRRRGDTHQN